MVHRFAVCERLPAELVPSDLPIAKLVLCGALRETALAGMIAAAKGGGITGDPRGGLSTLHCTQGRLPALRSMSALPLPRYSSPK